MIIFESLNLFLLINFFFTKKIKNIESYLYIYEGKLDLFIKFIFKLFFNIDFKKLNFKMMDIKDIKNEIYREIIPRKTLFDIENEFNKFYKFFDSQYYPNINNYLNKSFFAKDYLNKYSAFRILYLIHVVSSKCRSSSYLVFHEIPYLKIFKSYADKNNIKFISIFSFKYYFFLFYKFIRYLIKIKYYYFKIKKNKIITNSYNNVFCDGRSQPNLQNDGNFSDFFWVLNSNFKFNKVVYDCSTDSHFQYLKKSEIKCSMNFNSNFYKYHNIKKETYNIFNIDSLFSNSEINDYEYLFNKYVNYFKTYNVKAFLSWYKYDASHIAMYDAIKSLNGVGTIYQKNFDGHKFYECRTISDISFSYSKLSVDIDKNNISKIKNYIITGFPRVFLN